MLEYARRLPLPIIHDAHNVEFELIRRHAATLGLSPAQALAGREWRLVQAYERERYAACRLIFAVSERDAGIIRALAGPSADVRVMPISVDAAGHDTAWRPPADAGAALCRRAALAAERGCGPVTSSQDIWPLVRRDTPGATLTIVGTRRRPGGARAQAHARCASHGLRGRCLAVLRTGQGAGRAAPVRRRDAGEDSRDTRPGPAGHFDTHRVRRDRRRPRRAPARGRHSRGLRR